MVIVKEQATHDDCYELSLRIRDEDLKEILATRPGMLPDDALKDSVDMSYKTFSVMLAGEGCIAIFGVAKSSLGGNPWMIASDRLFEVCQRRFIRECKDYFKILTEDFSYCINYVSATNTKAHHWLSWMGFNLNKEQSVNINGMNFHPFTYTRK